MVGASTNFAMACLVKSSHILVDIVKNSSYVPKNLKCEESSRGLGFFLALKEFKEAHNIDYMNDISDSIYYEKMRYRFTM